MRKLKLQMQLTVDGFVAGPKGEMDWMVMNWDDELKKYINEITEPVDCILLGRKLAEGFIDAWDARTTNPEGEDIEFIRKMNETPKIVFSRTLKNVGEWKNTKLAKGDLAEEVNKLKSQNGKDIIAYGGANFVSNLIQQGLIDELHLFGNPTAIGSGMTIFEKETNLKLNEAISFSCGIVALNYQPSR
jgi:dihydrofolate reductase